MQRLSIAMFLGALIEFIGGRTGTRCVIDPDGEKSPFYAVELVKSEPADTKTCYVDSYEVWVHCISAPTSPYSSAPVLNMVTRLEEAMGGELELPEPFWLFAQDYGGLQTLKRDGTGEGHAVLSFDFRVCYGFRCK